MVYLSFEVNPALFPNFALLVVLDFTPKKQFVKPRNSPRGYPDDLQVSVFSAQASKAKRGNP